MVITIIENICRDFFINYKVYILKEFDCEYLKSFAFYRLVMREFEENRKLHELFETRLHKYFRNAS